MGKLSTGIFLILMVGLVLVSKANGNDEQKPPLYTSYGISPGGFGIYDRQFLGAGGYLSMPAISPFYLSQAISNFGRGLILDDKLKKIEWWVEFLTDKEINLRENYNTVMGQFQQSSGMTKRFSSDPWGFCIANGDNQQTGADNLFLVSFPEANSVIWIDYAHTKDLWGNGELLSSLGNIDDDTKEVVGKIADILGIDIPSIKIPGVGNFDLPNSPTSGGVDHFRNPRGICTNGKGEFWIADNGNNQIVRARFNTEENFVELLGMLKGLNSPSDVCVFPGVSQDSPEIIGIANTGGHSIVFTKAQFFGDVNLQDQQKYVINNVYLNNSRFNISSPLGISSSKRFPDECYLTCANNKIVKLNRLGEYEFLPVATIDWPLQGVLTGIQTDQAGDPFVVDNTNNYVGKYTRDLQLLFTTGGSNPDANTLVDDFKYGYIYFENPKYVTFGNDDKSVFVTERMKGYNGIKRFVNWPRFLDGSNSFGLKCNQNSQVDDSKMEIRFSLTKNALIDVNILRVDGDDQRVFFDSRNYSEFNDVFSSGHHVLTYDFNDQEGASNSSIAYICSFRAFDPSSPDEESDNKTYIVSLGAPNFFDDAILTNNYFNPAKNVFPQLSFEITRGSRVTFCLVRQGDSYENGITIAQGLFERNLTDPHVIDLHEIMEGSTLVPMTFSNVENALGDQSYELWASLEALPCGASNQLEVPLSVAKTIRFDGTNPELQFTAAKNRAYSDQIINGVNPQDSRFNRVDFQLTPSDNSDANTWTKVAIRKNEADGQLIREYDESEEIGNESRLLSYSFEYNGTGIEELCISADIRDMAGNSTQYNPVASDPQRLIKVDSRAPDIAVSFSTTHESQTVTGGLAAVLTDQQTMQIDFNVTDAFPKSIYINLVEEDGYNWQPRNSFSRKIDCSISPLWTGTDKSWTGSFQFSASDFPEDGVYSFSIIAEDYLGNSTVSTPVTSISGRNLIYVNKYPPTITANVLPKVIRKGEKNTLAIDAKTDSEDPDAEFNYTCDIYLSWKNSSGVFQDLPAYTQRNVQITSSQPSIRIQFDHSLLASQNTGHFRYRVIAGDNVGTNDLQTEQYADFFVETFPPVISGDFSQPLPRKFHVMGQIGDPDLTNDPMKHGFDYYTVYYTSGVESVLPSSISSLGANWKQGGIFVPFHTIDRKKDRAFDYPLSNVADNYQAVTSAWGLAPLFSVDAVAGNMADGTYTFLIYAHEAGIGDALSVTNSTLRTITIGNEGCPEISGILVDGSNGPENHSLNTAHPQILFQGNISDPGYKIDAVVSAFIYRVLDKEGGAAVKDPIYRRIELNSLSGGEFSFAWDGRDDRGAFVPNGVYHVAISLREKTKSGYSHIILDDHPIIVETPLVLSEGELAPRSITQLPMFDQATATTVKTNVTTFRCKASKPCKVFLNVETPAGETFVIGGVETQGGPGVEVVIDWDGMHPATGLPVPVCNTVEIYKLRPYAVGTEPNATEVDYLFPSDGDDFFSLTVVKNEENTNLTGVLSPSMTTGSSDAVWSNPVNGHLWSFPELTTEGVGLNVKGQQVIERNVDGTFSGTYDRFHYDLKFKLRWRLKFGRYYYFTFPIDPRDDVRCGDGYIIQEKQCYVTFNEFYWRSWDSPEWFFDPSLNKNVVKWSISTDGVSVNNGELTGVDPSSGFPGNCGTGWGTNGSTTDPVLLWVQIIGNDADGNEVLVKTLYNSGQDPYFTPQPEPVLPSGFFYNIDDVVDIEETPDFPHLRGSWLIDPDIFRDRGNLPTHSLTAGQQKTSIIIGDNNSGVNLAPWNEGLLAVVDPDGYTGLELDLQIPNGGTLVMYPGDATYERTYSSSTSLSFNPKFHIPPPYQRQLVFDYDIRLNSNQTTSAQVVMPLPDRDLCIDNGSACSDCDVWDVANSYVYDGAVIADVNSCDLTLSYPSLSLTSNYRNSNLTGSLLSDARFDNVIKNDASNPLVFSFPGGVSTRRTTHVVNGYSHYLDWNISNNTLSVNYPREETNASKNRWNTSSSIVNGDPILAANNHSLSGYLQTGDDEIVYNPNELSITKSFNTAPFTMISNSVSLFDVYAKQALKLPSMTIPSYAQTFAGDAWKNNESAWYYLCWYDASGNLRFHDGRDGNDAKGLSASVDGNPLLPWGEISLTYIDPGKVNDCFVLKNDTRGTGQFSFSIAPLAAPRRIVPVEVELTSAPDNLVVTELLAFDSRALNGSWENVDLVQPAIPVSSDTKTLLAYWDVTGKAGAYHLKVVAQDGTNSYQLLTTIRIGTEVPEDKTGTALSPGFTAYSPLKKVELWFPPNSPYKGMIGVDPVKLDQLRNAGFDGAPKGFLVDITPSGLVFDGPVNTLPSLSFYLTKEEVEQIGGRVDELGLISVYYFNDKSHRLESANFSPTLYNLNSNGSINRSSRQDVGDGAGIVMNENQVLELKGNLLHTSVYGVVSSGAFIWIDPPVTPTVQSTVTLTGKIYSDEITADVHIYQSSLSQWSASAIEITSDLVLNGDGTWSLPVILNNGDNYIFASIGSASAVNYPTNSVMINRDSDHPVISDLTVSPEFVTAGIDAVVIGAKLSESGEMYLSIPFLSQEVIYRKTDNAPYNVVFTIPVDNQIMVSDGDYPFHLTANDHAGNYADNSLSSVIRVDRTAPFFSDLYVLTRFDNVENIYKADVSGLVRDAMGLDNIRVYIRDGDPGWEYVLNGSNAVEMLIDGTISIDRSTIPAGEVMYVVVEATDMAGNKASCERPFVLEDQEQLSDWPKKKDIIINVPVNLPVSGDLRDIPLVIKLDNSNFDFSEATADGHDIRFAQGGLILPYEIELWDSEESQAVIWVKINRLVSGIQNQNITMYWGNGSAETPLNSQLVWDKNFKAVYHMNTFDADGEKKLSPFVLYSSEKTDVRDGAEVSGQKIGSGNYIEIGADASVSGDIYCVRDAFFRSNASVTGDVYLGNTLDVQSGVTINGNLNQNYQVQQVQIPEQQVITGTDSRVVERGNALDLLAGNYREITVRDGGTLRLHGGVYQFDVLRFDAGAAFEIDLMQGQSVYINTQTMLGFGDRVKCTFTGVSSVPGVFFYSNQTSELSFGVGSLVYGSVVAPFAPVSVYSGAVFTGSIMAKSVTVERNTIITGFSEGQNAPSVEQFIKDATLHEMHAEDKGVAETRGLIGIAQSFNGTSSYIRCPSLIKTPNDQQLTISGWLRREKSGLQENLIGVNGSERSMRFLVDENNSYILRSQSEQVQSSENVAGDGDWAYFTCSYDNSKMRLHINGILAEEKTTDSPIPADEVPVYIGKWLDTYFFEGKIDELWVSDIARSDFWIRLTYENQKENSRMVIVPPRAPRGIQTTLIYPSSVKITWDAGSSIDLIEIERAEINSDTWTRVANVPVISSEFIDNVECGKTFVYRFRYSTSGVASDYSQEETIRLFVCPEEVPSSVTAQPADENSVLLTWIDNATGESGYDIQMKNISEDEFTSISTALPDATTSVIGNLTCNTNYSFRIRVVKGDYSSEWAHSNPVSTEACSNAPRSPSQLTVRFNVNRYVLSWTDNSNDEEYFAIYRAATSTSSVNSDGFELLDIIPAGVTNYEDATYPCGKYLTYKVTAFNTVSGGGLSSPSNSVQVLSAPCTENNGNNLITLSCMLMDDWGNPVTQQGARITVNLYADPLTNTSLYSETFTVDVRNGYLRVNLGTYNDVGEVVKNNSKLYYEVTFNNMRIPLRQPLTSYMNSINNSMMLRGDDSPIGTIDAVPGSLYLNTVSQKLYFKFGPSVNDWKRVE